MPYGSAYKNVYRIDGDKHFHIAECITIDTARAIANALNICEKNDVLFLRGALRRYGQHEFYCPQFPAIPSGPCTCGLNDALET